MFEELYDKIEKKLTDNDITEASVIKDYCDEMVKKTFKRMFPNYDGYVGNAESLILECAKNLAENYDGDEEEIYDSLSRELDVILPGWEKYVDINNLSNSISDSFVNKYYKDKYENKDDNAKSFSDVIKNTINRNVTYGYEFSDKYDLEKLLRKIFHEYFDKGNIRVFTTNNDSREYVKTHDRTNILKEMAKVANIDTDDVDSIEDEIVDNYIQVICKSTNI